MVGVRCQRRSRELRRRALGALAGDGGVSRDRVAVTPGSVSFSERGTDVGVRPSCLLVDTVCIQGAVVNGRLDAASR